MVTWSSLDGKIGVFFPKNGWSFWPIPSHVIPTSPASCHGHPALAPSLDRSQFMRLPAEAPLPLSSDLEKTPPENGRGMDGEGDFMWISMDLVMFCGLVWLPCVPHFVRFLGPVAMVKVGCRICGSELFFTGTARRILLGLVEIRDRRSLLQDASRMMVSDMSPFRSFPMDPNGNFKRETGKLIFHIWWYTTGFQGYFQNPKSSNNFQQFPTINKWCFQSENVPGRSTRWLEPNVEIACEIRLFQHLGLAQMVDFTSQTWDLKPMRRIFIWF